MKTPSISSLVRFAAIAALLACQSANAATQYAAGSITWDNASTAAWSATSGGPYGSTWTSGSDAVLEGTAGTVTIASPTAHNLTFNTSGYTLSGASTLTLNGTAPTLSLGSGISATISSVIGGSAGLTKSGAGTLTLNGSAVNTFTGTLNLSSGTLALDFSNLATPTDLLNSAVIPTLGGGTLAITGKSSGTTSQTLGNVTTTSATASKILVNPNGGTSTTVALGTLTTNTGATLLIGKPSGAGSGTANISTSSTLTYTNGAGRIIYTSDGGTTVDFVTKSGSNLIPVASYTALGGAAAATTTPWSITGSGPTRTAVLTTGVLKITPNGAGQSFDLGALLQNSIQGGLLVTGSYPYEIKATGGGSIASPNTGGNNMTYIQQYNTGGLLISAVYADQAAGTNAVGLMKGGPEKLTLSAANLYSGVTYISEGTLSIGTVSNGSNAKTIATTAGSPTVTTADTSSGFAVGMSCGAGFPMGTTIQSIDSPTQITMTANCATAVSRSIAVGYASNLGVAPAAAANLVIGDATLQFTGSTGTSDRAFTIQAGKTATFDVTGTSLTLAGATGSTTTGSLTKTGAGTLVLTGINTYSGATTVTAGTLKLNNPNVSNETSTVTIASTGAAALELNFSGTDTVGKLFIDSTPMANGVYKAVGSSATGIEIAQITGTGTLTVGSVSGSYTVTYNGNGSDGGSVPTDSSTYSNGATVTVLTNSGSLTKTGFVFSGWNTLATGLGSDRAAGGTFTMGSANVTLYAKWVSTTTYTVTYDGNASDSGSVPTDSGAYLNGATVTVLTNSGSLTKAGFVFSGWNTLATGLGSDRPVSSSFTMGTANVTLYAKWVSSTTYTVTYDGNGSDGGTVPTDSSNYLNGATVTAMANTGTLTRTNSSFIGWNTAANGSGTSYAATGSATFTISSTNVTLYAQWTVTATWANSGATNGNWNTADNWVSGIVPGSTAPITGSNADAGAAIFNTTLGSYASAANPLVIDSTSENIKNITFDTAAGNFVIGSTGLNPLFLTSGGSIQIPNTLTATNALETINAPLVIEGASGNYAITNNSAVGTGANAGTLQIGGGITGGAAGSTVLTLNGSNTNANTLSGIIAQGSATSLAITKADSGTWILSNDNRYIGATNITGGTLKLGAAGGTTNTPLGTTAAGTTVSAGALDLNGFSLGTAEALSISGTGVSSTGALTNSGAAATYSGVVTLAAASSIGGSGDISLTSGLVGNLILTKVGANALTLSSASSRSGETKLSAGTLILNNDTAIGSGQLTITAAGTTIDNTSGAPRTLTNVLATSSTFDFSVFNSGSTATSNLSFTGTTALAIPSAGSPAPPRTITLNGTGTTLTLGAVTAQANAAGGKLQIDGPGNTLVMASLITNSNTASVHNFILQGTANVTINGTVSNPSGAGTFTVSSTGTVTFKGANSYTGATTVTAGTLALVGGSQVSPITVNSGASLGFTLGSSTSSSNTLNFLAGSKVKITGSASQPSYTLMTASAFPGVLPTLDPAVPGYSLVVDGSALKLSLTGGTSAFNTWAISPPNNLVGTDAAFDFDYDNDGIANGLEWILGGNPKLNDSATILPTSAGNAAAGLTLVFSRNPDSITTSTLVVEWNTDLAAFTNTVTVGASNVNVPPVDNSPSVYIDTPTSGKVTVIIPAANAPTGKIFARLKATLP